MNFLFALFCIFLLPVVNGFIFDTPVFPYFECHLRFVLTQFDFGRFEKYDDYFNEDSVMRLTEAGVYVGPKNIKEYMGFQSGKYSPYFLRDSTLRIQTDFKGYDSETNECTFLSRFLNQYELDPKNTGKDTTWNTVVMTNVRFSFNTRKIPEVNIFLPLGFLVATFDDGLNNDITREYICSVANNNCANTTAHIDNCESRLAELPVFNDGSFVDGDSQGCRALHAVFAETNNDHCAHIALNATEDRKGAIKCQNSNLMNPSDYFTPADFREYDKYMVSQGIDPEIGYVETSPCSQNSSCLETSPVDLFFAFLGSYFQYLTRISFGRFLSDFNFIRRLNFLLSFNELFKNI